MYVNAMSIIYWAQSILLHIPMSVSIHGHKTVFLNVFKALQQSVLYLPFILWKQ